MNPFPWYARYPADYGNATAHLSLAEHGAYTLLLDHYYLNGPMAIAINLLAACYRVCRAQTDEERSAVESVVKQFFTVEDDGCLHNQRADKELANRKNVSETRSSVGKMGAQARWKAKEGMPIAIANAMPEAMPLGMANGMAKGMANRCTSTSTSTIEEIKPPLIPPSQGEPQKKVSERKAKGTRLPADWCHEPVHEDIATEVGVSLYHEYVKFKDYFIGEGKVKADWSRTFSVWLRNAGERKKSTPNWSRR